MSRPKPSPRMRMGKARWDALDNDALHEIFQHFDDRMLGRLARIDRRTRRVAYAATKARLGLGDSQWEVFKAVLHRCENVLLLGTPGSGKSFLLKVLKDRVPNPLVTASTAAAAEKIDAWTLHAALGLGLADKPAVEIAKKLRAPSRGGRHYPKPCQTCNTIIVDEVSMLTAKTFDLAWEVVAIMRNHKMPQIVASGDPMQLGAVGAETDGAFYASELTKKLRPYVLTESFRQTTDSKFLSILNRARLGCAREYDREWLVANACANAGPDAPRLFCKNSQVHEYNDLKLATIPHPVTKYCATTTGETCAGARRQEWDNELPLKIGARVMLKANLAEYPWVHNGSCGVVLSLASDSVLVKFDVGRTLTIRKTTHEFKKDDRVVGVRTEMPLLLAWAVSIHRAQGATLDRVVADLSACFAKGQAYVALSRVREIQHLELRGELKLSKLNNVDKKALGWYEECKKRSERRVKRHCERDKQAERNAHTDQVDDAALNAMMDVFEAGGA